MKNIDLLLLAILLDPSVVVIDLGPTPKAVYVVCPGIGRVEFPFDRIEAANTSAELLIRHGFLNVHMVPLYGL
jgi:hypothetical protein